MSKKQLVYGALLGGMVLLVGITLLFFFSGDLFFSTPEGTTASTTSEGISTATTTPEGTVQYVEVVDGCNPYFVGECVNVRSGPGLEYAVVSRLRTGVVLRVAEAVTRNGSTWYKIEFSHELAYPERVQGSWYVAASLVKLVTNESDHELVKGQVVSTTKRIIVDVSEEKLYAYEGDKLFMEQAISTGLEFTPTPRGTFTVFKMTPSRFMQGPIRGVSDQVYDLPGVPWNLYFTENGAVIHGAYWHDHFGMPWSHGCVNLPPNEAKKLYDWAYVGIQVTVQD